jgi:hypothetical protein
LARNGKIGRIFQKITDWGFDPSGKHVGYRADETLCILDEKEVTPAEEERWALFQSTRQGARTGRSPDGKHVASSDRRGGKVVVSVDGLQVSEHFFLVPGGEPTWLDNRVVRWVAAEPAADWVMFDIRGFEFTLNP